MQKNQTLDYKTSENNLSTRKEVWYCKMKKKKSPQRIIPRIFISAIVPQYWDPLSVPEGNGR